MKTIITIENGKISLETDDTSSKNMSTTQLEFECINCGDKGWIECFTGNGTQVEKQPCPECRIDV